MSPFLKVLSCKRFGSVSAGCADADADEGLLSRVSFSYLTLLLVLLDGVEGLLGRELKLLASELGNLHGWRHVRH